MIPYGFTVTSHIIVTAALALLVIGVVIVYGFMKHGTHFFGLFVPSGVPRLAAAAAGVIEVISFLSRPISLSVRLFANMLAGHIALKIFAGFVGIAARPPASGACSRPLPLALTVALTALELLVAVLQAYVFATLTSHLSQRRAPPRPLIARPVRPLSYPSRTLQRRHPWIL